jgi:hypothetical protein
MGQGLVDLLLLLVMVALLRQIIRCKAEKAKRKGRSGRIYQRA